MNTIILFFLTVLCHSVFAFEGIVEKKEFRLAEYRTVNGDVIKDLVFGFETYGKLNEKRSNAVLLTHHYTGNSHAAGKYKESDSAPGYWDSVIGSGKAIDTDKFFVIAVDSLVNVGTRDPMVKTTGPASIDPRTKKPFGFGFPKIDLKDFVKTQSELLSSLGITELHAVIGASGGAMQAMTWAAEFPEKVPRVIAVVPPGLSLPPYVVALVNRWCAPILLDPEKGLVESLKLVTLSSVYFDWGPRDAMKIEAALEERARARALVMDPVSFVYTGRAVQTFDVEKKISAINAKVLFVPAEHDMIFPVELSEKAAAALRKKGKKADVFVLRGRGGHLDGITAIDQASAAMRTFLSE